MKIIFLLILVLSPSFLFSDIINFYEGFNKLREINCKITSINTTFVTAMYMTNTFERDVKIHISRIYYIKFNNNYFSLERINPQDEWQELYNVSNTESKRRIYLKNVSDSLRNSYKNIKFIGKDTNIIIGDILYYCRSDSTIQLSALMKTERDSVLSDWTFVPYITTWYRF